MVRTCLKGYKCTCCEATQHSIIIVVDYCSSQGSVRDKIPCLVTFFPHDLGRCAVSQGISCSSVLIRLVIDRLSVSLLRVVHLISMKRSSC